MFNSAAAQKIKTPESMEKILSEQYPHGKLRLDGIWQNGNDLWLAIIPKNYTDNKEAVGLILKTDDEDFLFSNNWIYTPIKNNTVKSFDFYVPEIQKLLMGSLISKDFIIPKDFLLPRDLAPMAGHLPLKFRSVELASGREARYRDLLQDNSRDLNILSYAYASGELLKLQNDLKPFELNEINGNFSLISAIKSFKDKLYFSDYNKARILEFKDLDSKPQQLIKLSTNAGLKDFIFSKEGNLLYVLSNKHSQLLIFDMLHKEPKLIKTVDLPANSFKLGAMPGSGPASDLVLIGSRSSSEILQLGSFDHRISGKIKTDNNKKVILNDFVSCQNSIFVANELLKKTEYQGEILVLDPISRNIQTSLALNYNPKILVPSQNQEIIFILGTDKENKNLSVFSYEVATLKLLNSTKLDADFIGPGAMILSRSGQFLMVGSTDSNFIGVLDTGTLELLYKSDIATSANILLELP